MRGSKIFQWNGAAMKSRRSQLGMSLAELGEQIGTARSYVWEIEEGCQPTIGYAYHIAKILKKPLSFFVREC